jgi:hypothetical protein
MPNWLYYSLRSIKRGFSLHRPNSPIVNLLGDRDIEWSWVLAEMPSGPGVLLDFGVGGSNLALVAAQKGFNVTAIDLEPVCWAFFHPNLRFIQGDILEISFPEDHFDVIINCSTIEHVGLAGRYGIEVGLSDGDLIAMDTLKKFMKPDGLMLLTIPVGQDGVFPPYCRVYGQQRLPELLKGFVVEKEIYWIKDNENRWVMCDRHSALGFKPSVIGSNPLKTAYALGCFMLKR